MKVVDDNSNSPRRVIDGAGGIGRCRTVLFLSRTAMDVREVVLAGEGGRGSRRVLYNWRDDAEN